MRRGGPRRPSVGTVELDALQQGIAATYGERDAARGVPATVAWLAEELGELAQAVRKGSPEQQLHELGDVLAWLASLAVQLDLSLDDGGRPLRRRLPALRRPSLHLPVRRGVQRRARRASAIWTALRAAPLRRLSPRQEQRQARPSGTVGSWRIRPTWVGVCRRPRRAASARR